MSDPTASGPVQQSHSFNLGIPERALAIGAHPDDIEFGCGGTLAKWAAAGCQIHHLVCTDGSKGSWDPSADLASLVALRYEEQRRAAQVLGGTGEVTFLGAVDGELTNTEDLRRQIARWIRQIRPEVVLGHDPWKRYRLHPDHRSAGFLTTDGIVAARDPHFFAELGMQHHRPQVLLLWEADSPNHLEDIAGFEDVKISAILAHQSQSVSTMGIAENDFEATSRAFSQRVRTRHRNNAAGSAFEAAEVFHQISDL